MARPSLFALQVLKVDPASPCVIALAPGIANMSTVARDPYGKVYGEHQLEVLVLQMHDIGLDLVVQRQVAVGLEVSAHFVVKPCSFRPLLRNATGIFYPHNVTRCPNLGSHSWRGEQSVARVRSRRRHRAHIARRPTMQIAVAPQRRVW